MSDGACCLNKVKIPKSLSDVNSSWLISLLRQIEPELSDTHGCLSHLQISPFETTNEGIFDRCRVLMEFEKPVAKTFNWVVQIVPQIDPDLKEIIIRHRLFEKCILVYGEIIRALNQFKNEKSSGKILQEKKKRYHNFKNVYSL